MDIHLERGNANKLMNRLLYGGLNYGIRISEINGGSLRNAIPRESTACVVVESEEFLTDLDALITQIKSEYQVTEPDMIVEVVKRDLPIAALSVEDSKEIIFSISSVFNGVFKMSQTIDGLVETSSSLARVILKDGLFITQSLQRSSVESSKKI